MNRIHSEQRGGTGYSRTTLLSASTTVCVHHGRPAATFDAGSSDVAFVFGGLDAVDAGAASQGQQWEVLLECINWVGSEPDTTATMHYVG